MIILDTDIVVRVQCDWCYRVETHTYSVETTDEAMVEAIISGCPHCNNGKSREDAMREILG